MGILAFIPLTIIPVILYALIALPAGLGVVDILAQRAFAMPMPSGQEWLFTWGGLILLLSIVCLFIDILKSTRPSRNAMIDNGLSVAVFILCFLLFLLVQGFASTEFFLIMAMTLLDFIAGSVIMVSAAQRTVQYSDPI